VTNKNKKTHEDRVPYETNHQYMKMDYYLLFQGRPFLSP
jgi:hypothetical protein